MEAGTTIGHYRIIRQLGKGGMGEVYLAEDTRLDRQVAIKVLPERLRQNTERLARFRREAKAAASLTHPNIATIYALEDIEDLLLITMEYVDGKPLSGHIPSGGMDLDTFFATFIPLADALAHAHGHGRIHRDLKPANIMIAPDGTPKILDFGLARIIDPDPVQAAFEESETETTPEIGPDDPTVTMKPEDHDNVPKGLPSLTRGGQLMGTPQYMSPEQAERRETDARTDIFSFGVVMYEALTGQKLFDGETLESIIGRILEAEPQAVTEIKPVTPHQLWWTMRGCLEKDREKRTPTAQRLHTELQYVQSEVQAGRELVDKRKIPEPAQLAPKTYWRQPVVIGVAVLTLVVGIFATWVLKPAPPVPEPPLRKFKLTVEAAQNQTYDAPAISPDGTMIAYSQGSPSTLWIRDLNQFVSREIPDSDGAQLPFWSPASDAVGYFARGSLRTVPAPGGTTTQLCALPGVFFRGGTWSSQATIVFNGYQKLFQISARGGEPSLLMAPDSALGEASLVAPHFLPDGRTLVYNVVKQDGTMEIVLHTGATLRTRLPLPGRGPVYSSTGHLLYQQGVNIWAVAFSLSSLTVTGEPFVVSQAGNLPSVSTDGTLVFSMSGSPQQLVWVDRSGQIEGPIGQPRDGWTSHPALSPDDSQVAIEGGDIHIYDVTSGAPRRLTFDGGIHPTWFPGGDQIAFSSDRISGIYNGDIFSIVADGTKKANAIVIEPLGQYHPHWSRDGHYLTYTVLDYDTVNRDLWYMPLEGDRKPVPFLQNSSSEALSEFSVDSRYLAYESNESGRWEVYVRSFPGGEGRWQISDRGGTYPKWSGRGDEMFFVQGNTLMAVDVQTEPSFSYGRIRPLFSGDSLGIQLRVKGPPVYPRYDVTRDGQRFVMIQSLEETGTINVVQNWYAEFKDRE